jgi:glyoxylase-like metal-dependent hydrolase (beta-lactamase superfamily II)
MDCYICQTCGVQHVPSEEPPARCAICEDERQYVGWAGQRWTTLDEMRHNGYAIEVRGHEPGLTGLCVTPSFGIGQRSLLAQTPEGNVLWDCQSYLDQTTIERVRALGGIAAISASHPHFYGAMVEWSRAFDAPIHLPRADAAWVMRPDPAVRFWDGDRLGILPGITLVRCGGHFAGSSVLHWEGGASGRGALLVGDTIQVVQDRRYVSIMRSYPNLIPLPPSTVARIAATIDALAFDHVYGGWWDRDILEGAKDAVGRSARRYIERASKDPDTS